MSIIIVGLFLLTIFCRDASPLRQAPPICVQLLAADRRRDKNRERRAIHLRRLDRLLAIICFTSEPPLYDFKRRALVADDLSNLLLFLG
jgi:hypothetical protein